MYDLIVSAHGVTDFDDSFKGKFCVVTYDGKPYPGIIQEVDASEIEVNVMHSVGDNRFFWPRTDDVLWYSVENVVTLIPPPKQLTRHYEIDRIVWNEIKDYLNI